MVIALQPDQLIDVRPYLPRNDDNPISSAERARDQLAEDLQRFCNEFGLEAMIAPSPPYSGSVWVRLEAWRRVDGERGLGGRASVQITINSKPFHRYPHEWALQYDVCGMERSEGPFTPLAEDRVRAVVKYVAGMATRPDLKDCKFADTLWTMLIRPVNKIERVRTDPLMAISGVLLVAGIFAFAINPISSVLLLFASGVGFIYRWREPRLVLSTGRPKQEPRSLIRLDSWQTVLRGLGDAEQSFRAKLAKEVEQGRPADATFTDEEIWYWGVDGKEQRRQIVVTFRRAIAFVQIYAYHRDLYVSWDSHVNAGTWKEVQISSGIDRASGFKIVAQSIEKDWHVPHEYDIADASYLSEWLHAVVTELVKEALAEHKVVQDIDFKILRERRRGIAGARNERAIAGSAE
jgi:hypothetical protein